MIIYMGSESLQIVPAWSLGVMPCKCNPTDEAGTLFFWIPGNHFELARVPYGYGASVAGSLNPEQCLFQGTREDT